MKYLYPLVATNEHGETKLFYDADAFRAFAFSRDRVVGKYWYESEYFGYTTKTRADSCLPVRRICNWIVRDDRGRVVNVKDFHLPQPRYYHWRGKYQFRSGPVPNTGCSKAGYKQDAPRKRHGGRGVAARNNQQKMLDEKLIRRVVDR